MGFLGPEFEDAQWLEQVSRIPQRPPHSWRTLPAAERDRLTAACHPGLALLGYA